jgi:hypothetical protein
MAGAAPENLYHFSLTSWSIIPETKVVRLSFLYHPEKNHGKTSDSELERLFTLK